MEKLTILVDIHYLLLPFKRYTWRILEDTENKRNNFATELKNFDKPMKTIEKKSFFKLLRINFRARAKILNNFKSRFITIKI